MYYSIVALDDEGQSEALAEFSSYKEADEMFDFYAEQNPYAMVDIVEMSGSYNPPR